jgi:hypothetical protein
MATLPKQPISDAELTRWTSIRVPLPGNPREREWDRQVSDEHPSVVRLRHWLENPDRPGLYRSRIEVRLGSTDGHAQLVSLTYLVQDPEVAAEFRRVWVDAVAERCDHPIYALSTRLKGVAGAGASVA